MSVISRVGKRGTVVIPVELRRRFGIEEGSLVIAEARDGGVLIRPTTASPTDKDREQFYAALDHAYEALRDDPAAWEDEQIERKVLAGTLLDGLDLDEVWTEDGDVVYQSPTRDAEHE